MITIKVLNETMELGYNYMRVQDLDTGVTCCGDVLNIVIGDKVINIDTIDGELRISGDISNLKLTDSLSDTMIIKAK